MKKLVLFLMIVLGLSLLANTTIAFRLSPASLKIEVKRGTTYLQILDIGNSSTNPISCRIYTTGLEVQKDGKQLFEEATTDYSAATWIISKEPTFEIPANSTKEVTIEIAVPRNTRPGEYFATIMTESTAPARTRNSERGEISMAVNFRLGCITRITVPGRTIRKKAEVSTVKVEVPNPDSENQDIIVTATLENQCSVHLDAKGTVLIKNTENRIFDKFVLQGAGKNARGEAFIFPQGSRDFWGIIERPLPPGEYVAEVSFSYGYRSRKVKGKAFFTVSPELGKKQKELLVFTVESNLIELEMTPGAFRTYRLKISNLDFEPLKIKIVSQSAWLEIKPSQLTIRPNRSKTLRIEVSVPADEPIKRIGKILLTPERGKEIVVDVVVSEYKKGE